MRSEVRRLALTAAAALLFAVVVAIGQARSGRLGTIHWPVGARIDVWIDPARAPEGAGELVERAMRTWTRAADGRFQLVRSPSPESPMRVRFAGATGLYGEAAPELDPRTGHIAAADVFILSSVPGDALDRALIIYLTALHELGHALGLAHTDDFDTIMYAFRRPDDGPRFFGAYRTRLTSVADIGSSAATGLSEADVTALAALYAQ
ncbi:MAG: matrixin family metalloprotease [Acidimicrobiia bacterium]|nr:matrixin family metalloprotease [Acidimicrobiia bacterium]